MVELGDLLLVVMDVMLVAVVQGAEVLTYLVDQVTEDLEDLVEFQI